ncbi:MAG: class I SAM-dependent methyltransferase [Bdellovibrionales bacterium]|nr:class I SAM-dependent methyltransferase [Bdellovibrionales bacterium]
MSRFDPESYLRYRIEYPEELFLPLAPFVCQRRSPFHLLDLGAGTGLSTRSFLRFFPGVERATLVDPDPAMLAVVKGWQHDVDTDVRIHLGTGESFEACEPADLILVGSAWHWMNTQATLESVKRALKPGGALFIFEYQFPKVREGGRGFGINEWIRRSFNSTWKEQDQKPRGSLQELLKMVRQHCDFSFRGETRMERDFALSSEDFFGLILSQSRYLAYERQFEKEQITVLRAQLFQNLRQIWEDGATHSFVYRFHGVRFQVRSV